MALCWACLSSIFYQGAQHLTEDCRYVSSALGREKGSLLLTFWLRSALVQVRMLLSFFATYCITASLFFFWQAVFQHGLVAEIIPLLEQVFLFPSVELHEVAAIPFPYPVEFPLNGSATIRRYQTFLPVLYHLLRVQPFPSSRLMMKTLSNFVSSDNPLWYISSDWPPTGLWAADHSPLSQVHQFSVHKSNFSPHIHQASHLIVEGWIVKH